MKAYAIICLSRADDTFQPDGRCEYRKSKGNRSKRSLSLKNGRRDYRVTESIQPSVAVRLPLMWQASIILDWLSPIIAVRFTQSKRSGWL